mgnify:FL=1
MYNDISIDYLLKDLDINFTSDGIKAGSSSENEATTPDNVDLEIQKIIDSKN